MYYSYQDFQKVTNKAGFIREFLNWYKCRKETITAYDAERYDRQQNTTIGQYARTYYTLLGIKKQDLTSSNNKIASNFFHRLNTQRCTYSLGNGVTFSKRKLKDRLGKDFDTRLYEAAYDALKHGICYMFWNVDHVHVFPATEFAPLWDEETGALMAGIRFWKLDADKPEYAIVYEIDGYQKFKAENKEGTFTAVDEKKAYRYTIKSTPAENEPEVIAAENYSALPIIPIYGNREHLSTLVGMKAAIDSYDLILSGFANDLEDCAECYWIISNADGMDDEDLMKLRDRMKLNHLVTAESDQITPYTQEVPYAARQQYLDSIKAEIYASYGGLDVTAISAQNQTATAIESAYQPMDENADDFEYQIIEAVRGILNLIGEEDIPSFKRNRIVNQAEQTNMILAAAQYLDDETIISKLPFITPDEINKIMKQRDVDDFNRFNMQTNNQDEETEDSPDDEEDEDEDEETDSSAEGNNEEDEDEDEDKKKKKAELNDSKA